MRTEPGCSKFCMVSINTAASDIDCLSSGGSMKVVPCQGWSPTRILPDAPDDPVVTEETQPVPRDWPSRGAALVVKKGSEFC